MGRWFAWLIVLGLSRNATPLWCAQAGQAGQAGQVQAGKVEAGQVQDRKVAAEAKQSGALKWPLRLHVLAIDDSHRTVRMQPNWASGSVPEVTADGVSPASNAGGSTLGGGEDDFSGAGRGDLVTPPNGTVGLNFTYEGCSRVRVAAGFQGLEARWKKPGVKLEVMIPTEAVTDGAVPMQRCTLKLVMQPFVYLRLPSGAIVRVSQEAYNRKPSLRMYLSGGSETLKRRTTRLPKASPDPASRLF